MKRQRVIICGSTGSIGTQSLEIIRCFPDSFQVVGLSVERNLPGILEQAKEFSVTSLFIAAPPQEKNQEMDFSQGVKFYSGTQTDFIRSIEADIVVLAVVGEQGVALARASLESGKDLALATKEVIVTAGKEISDIAKKYNKTILPLDSEPSAIWQCLMAGKKPEVSKIWLTCSGGPFRNPKEWPREKLQQATVAEALQHPNWKMGKKITIDSATLMNKALELIEISHLFQIPQEKIEVVIHPESHLHSAVEFQDGSIIGQIGTPDMRTAIAYALFYPDRSPLPFPKFSFFGRQWNFFEVDSDRFPSIGYARKAIEINHCRELNRANEQAVTDFLEERIGFSDIFKRVEKSLLSE